MFKIDWVCRGDLSFNKVQHLYNPWNEGKPVKIGRDGQEIQPSVGEELARLFSEDKTVELTPILRKSKEAARKHRNKTSVAKSGPLGGRHRVVSAGGRGRGRESGHRGWGGDRGRGGQRRPRYDGGGDRRYDQDDRRGGDRVRADHHDDNVITIFVQYRDRSPLDYYRGSDSRDYNDYLRSLAGHSSYHAPAYPHHYPPPARHYQGPVVYGRPAYSGYDERSRDYDRSVVSGW